ncbi:MAG: hypothetical protein Q7I97_01550 [Thermovirgaceae bacterium]|nr:hypothetical protein [Thermovirgaceae bacterium]
MIGFFKKMFASPEIKACYGALDEAEWRFSKPFHREAFEIIKKQIEKIILSEPGYMAKEINEDENLTPRFPIYSFIGCTSRQLLGSGQYHVYRNALNGIGEDLLKLLMKLQTNSFNRGMQTRI